jgi:non-ribosomal peptide synthetase component F
VKELLAFYDAFRQGEKCYLEPIRPYRDYIAWLQKQDLSKAQAFWRQMLRGFTTPTPLVDQVSAGSRDWKENYGKQTICLSLATTSALQSLARQHQLTLNVLVQGAWALLLSRYTGEEDVVFGAVVSGRPTDLAGAESMIGLFINTLPARARVSAESSFLSWVKELQAQQVEARQYEYSPLAQVQSWSDVPRGKPLFESILVFENFPIAVSARKGGGNLQIRWVDSFEATNYPICVLAIPGSEMLLGALYDRNLFDPATITQILDHFRILLGEIVIHPERRLDDIPLQRESGSSSSSRVSDELEVLNFES